MPALATDLAKGRLFIERVIRGYPRFRERMPEDLLPVGTDRGSESHLRFLTLVATIDYMRDADRLWKGAREAFADHPWMFDPPLVAAHQPDDVRKLLVQYRMARFPARDAASWHSVCRILHQSYEGTVGGLLEAADSDAPTLYAVVKSQSPPLTGLRGPKILPFWIRILHEEADVGLSGLNQIPLPIDINVVKATFMLGVLRGKVAGGSETFHSLLDRCQKAWIEVASGTEAYPLMLDEPLWLLGREDSHVLALFEDLLLPGHRANIRIGYARVVVDT